MTQPPNHVQLIASLEKVKRESASPLMKAVLEKLLDDKNVLQTLEDFLIGKSQDHFPFASDEETCNFFYLHFREMDEILFEFDNTSIGGMITEFFEELQLTVTPMCIDHCLRRALEKIADTG